MGFSKKKGSDYEREVVKQCQTAGFKGAERAWGSNGQAMGEHREVDVKFGPWKAQLKRRKKISQYITPSKNVDIQIMREDYGQSMVVIPLDKFLNLIKEAN